MAEGSDLESSLTKNFSPGVPLKVILLGAKGVGKTTLFRRIFHFPEKDSSDENCRNISEYTKPITAYSGRRVQMLLWDTAGMEGNRHERNLTRSHYLGTQVALLVYSADDWDSVEDLKFYLEDVESHAPGAKMFLIRNKVDLPRVDQTVNEQDVDGMFTKHGHTKFSPNWKLKTSALNGDGIDTLLKEVGEALLRQGSLKPDGSNSFQVFKQNQKPTKQKPTKINRSSSSSCC